ncbi:prephenate dehydratase [Cyanobacterium stanieri LEGE 03274]|uniref:Prephenate dehydratase n=1 Tax=Cyanobacterium stanieri LEGE 03274 TaxID=1828756 RepID=A0ABR9V3E0_9CHRO|nr:prephenate dehydratase [Cyanobacterium stanieri]MBE9222416.1 prephenate dehydratase [Cyanobacterium stanieri LEGE 03274]
MIKSIAHLGPKGTYSEVATLIYAQNLEAETGMETELVPYPNIAQTLLAVADGRADVAVVPVENSIQGIVSMTLDSLWELDGLQIQQGLTLPVVHNFLSRGNSLEGIKTVYSHPQALAQCQKWLDKHTPEARLVAANSTTEALQVVNHDPTAGAIASLRAAQLYDLPIKEANINDYPDNCTRFWVVSKDKREDGDYVSLGFSFEKNKPGVLVKPLQIFAENHINLTRIESRPTKRSLGEYLFFIDLQKKDSKKELNIALSDLSSLTKTLKIFGNYNVLNIDYSQCEKLSI